MQTLESQRLTLRMMTTDDASFINQLYNTKEFIQFIGDKQIRSGSDAEIYIDENILGMHREHGVCLMLVELTESKEKLGVCGLIKRPELDVYDIGYGYLPSSYGNGYGYEAGQAVLEYARSHKMIKEIAAITTSDNVGSQALLSKLGFTYIKVQESLSDKVDLLLYQMILYRD